MKIYRLLLIILLLSPVLFTSCDSSEPEPSATIINNKKVIPVGEILTLSSSAQNANRYEWDFGNGNSSTIANPSVVYDDPGTYTIRLTVYNSDDVASTVSTTIKVGYLTLKSVSVINFNSTYRWDTYDGPDLQLKLKPTNQALWLYYVDLLPNASASMLPSTSNLNNILLTDGSWDVNLVDDDGAPSSNLMESWQISTADGRNYETGEYRFILKKSSTEIRLTLAIQ